VKTFSPEPFGRYFLFDRMAVGGMAEIFRAVQLNDGGFQRIVVIKRIMAHLNAEQQFIDMFLNEARITSTLSHPNIVQIYDFEKYGNHYYIAMEYVQGKDLRALLKTLTQQGKLLPVDLAAYVGGEAARGLHFAHMKTDLGGTKLGIVHRDVSPANLLVSYDGNVRVADFGIARAESNLGHTRTGMLKGKFEYMSPEQIDLHELDGRSDVFALGVVLYNLLTGRRLFRGKSDLDTLENVRKCVVEPPSKWNPEVPARMDEIVLKSLARERDERYATGREMAEDLAEFLYPVSTDQMRETLGALMDEHFKEQRQEDMRILEEGTRLAKEIKVANASLESIASSDLELEPVGDVSETAPAHAAPPSSASAPSSTAPMPAAPPPRERTQPTSIKDVLPTPSFSFDLRKALPWLAAAGAVFGLVSIVAVLVWAFARTPDSDGAQAAGTVVTDASQPGTIQVDVDPLIPVELWVNGQKVADGTGLLSYDKLQPGGSVQVEVKAKGYAPYRALMVPHSGQVVRNQVRLEKLAGLPDIEVPVIPTMNVASGFRLESVPSAATVYIDGKERGATPYEWKDGVPGQTYDVEFRRPDSQPLMKKITFPNGGGVVTKEIQLQALEGNGTVNINVPSGMAEIWIDGKSYGEKSNLTQPLKAGKHSISGKFRGGGSDEKVVVIEKDKETRVSLEREL
jgi:serine/threonine protein kinase